MKRADVERFKLSTSLIAACFMTTLKLVNLMMRSSDHNPYTGSLHHN